jgi:branched-chain amino acid transport system substrate-binding protein
MITVLVLSLSGCGGGPNANEILIGHYASLTGNEATFGRSTDQGIKIAVDELNDAGGINGKKVHLITYDDKGDAREAGAAVLRLITQDGATAILGEVASGLSLAGAPICQENGVPMVTPSSTNPKVTKVGDMIFRVCFIDPFQGWVCAKFARENLKATKAAILYDQALPYSVGLQVEFERNFTQMGGTITMKQVYNAGDQDFTAQLTNLRNSGAEVIFLPGYYTDVGNIALQKAKLNVNIPLLGGDGWDSAKLGEIAGKDINGCYFSNHYSHQNPDPRVVEFIKKYKALHGSTPDSLAALGYDAARVLFEAMGRCKGLSGKEIAAELVKTKDFNGVTGTISFDAERNPIKSAVILEMKDGEPTWVATIKPAE